MILFISTKYILLLISFHSQVKVAGEDYYSTRISGGRYFYVLNLGNGLQINGSPTFSYNHKADR